MEECMKESMRKLAMWYTRTFKPIMTHEELETIMATLGFVGRPPENSWKEYVYSPSPGGRRGRQWQVKRRHSSSEAAPDPTPPPPPPPPPPLLKPRLPYPRIDGLHIYTYRAFIDAVRYYLGMDDISDLIHIRGMPLHRMHDRNRKWRRMEEDESVFVYKDGTLDQATHNYYHFDKNVSHHGTNRYNSKILGNQVNNSTQSSSCLVALKDIIV